MRNLFFKKNPYRALEKQLGYSFRKRLYLEQALLHRSFRFENAQSETDNQRLEFLGDAALTLVSGSYLYERFPDIQEGSLTCLRSRMTNGKALAQIAQAINLGSHMKLGKGETLSGGRYRSSTIADAMEAVLGAAFVDGGLKAVEKIFIKLFVPTIAVSPDDLWSDNPKGRLQQIAQQKWKCNPHYRTVHVDGPSHARVYTVEVSLNSKSVGSGKGSTKQAAETEAAAAAIEFLRY